MKLSIVAVTLFAAILGKANPIPDLGITTPATTEVAPDAGRVETSDSLTNVAASDSPALVESSVFADHSQRTGTACPAGLKVFGFARLADYTVRGNDFSGEVLANLYKTGKFDNYGGPIIAGAIAQSGYLPSTSRVFVQAQYANYYYHKQGSVSNVLKGLTPDTGYATYVQGECSQFSDPTVYAHCCQ
ncbi:hypothetical protein QFC19_002523 [Naganishia cerealis]|uniref:Uncharacterized protein n=1 Tax=Naganishia cerealis TaxID=610337 RepID=A0ACC2WAD3_9TREE|nr:hypothetical protein QFC19_002523 [Naganishia cerealis]